MINSTVSPGRWHWLKNTLWVVLLLSMPLTSFPFFPGGFGGATLVRPFAVYPLLILFPLFVLPALFRRRLPRSYLPLFVFICLALGSALLAMASGIEGAQRVSPLDRLLRNLVTLGLGVGLYLSISILPTSREELESALRWNYAGFGVALTWASFQAVYVLFFYRPYFQVLNRLQRLVSSRRLFEGRISGMTYEPNWFAEQICFFLLPWLLAAVLSGRSLFRWRKRWLTIELILLVWSLGLLLLTFSRAGLFTMLAVLVAGVLFFRQLPSAQPGSTTRRAPFRRAVEVGMLVVVVLGLVFAVGTRNNYFSRIWRFFTEEEAAGQSFFDYIAFGQRFTYWQTGLEMFAARPILGVGLGNYAFYFPEYVAREPIYRQPELVRQLTPDERGAQRLITPKNLYVRLLAETGVVGTTFFMVFIASVAGTALALWLSADPAARTWGAGGLLGVLVVLIGALSFDSFALPNMWVVLGLVSAAGRLHAETAEQADQLPSTGSGSGQVVPHSP